MQTRAAVYIYDSFKRGSVRWTYQGMEERPILKPIEHRLILEIFEMHEHNNHHLKDENVRNDF